MHSYLAKELLTAYATPHTNHSNSSHSHNVEKLDDQSFVSEPSLHKYNLLLKYLEKSLLQNRNIIISAEDLSQLSMAGINKLYEAFKPFDTTIIIVFRDTLTRAVSAYTHLMSQYKLSDTVFMQDFNSFLTYNMTRFDYDNIILKYSHYFGLSKIIIIDYYGLVAAQKNLLSVVLCLIDQQLCQELSQHNLLHLYQEYKAQNRFQSINGNNEGNHTSILISGIISEIRHAFLRRKCSIHATSENSRIVSSIINNQLNRSVGIVPRTIDTLDNTHEDFIYEDDLVRKKYAMNIMFNNREASILAVQRKSMEQLNVVQFRKSKYWQRWMQRCMLDVEGYNYEQLVSCPVDEIEMNKTTSTSTSTKAATLKVN
jgi:hypothetical protein